MRHKFVVIGDQHSKLLGHRFLNSQLSLYLGSVQLFFCLWALTQHIWAMASLKKVLHCDFSPNSSLPALLTHVDAIIFDIGLFHNLWGISGCVAQHLDGGYGRFCWCVAHSAALLFCLPFAFVSRPKPQLLWPLLIQQSAYGVGLLILSLAALPRAAHFLGDLSNAPLKAIAFYSLGTLMNFFLLYVYWHWYWHVETLWNSARKLRRGETFTGSATKRPIRRCSPPTTGGKAPLSTGSTATGQKPIRNGVIGGETERKSTPTGRGGESWANGETKREEGAMWGEKSHKKRTTKGEREAEAAEGEQGHRRTHHRRTIGRAEDDEDRRRVRHEDEAGGRRGGGRRTLPGDSDRDNLPHSASPSFGSTTASNTASTTTSTNSALKQQWPPNKKPPPPAPLPPIADNPPTQTNCVSNFRRPFSPNEMAFSSQHFHRNGSDRIWHNERHWHSTQHKFDYSFRCRSVAGPIWPLSVRSMSTKAQKLEMDEPDQEEQQRTNGYKIGGRQLTDLRNLPRDAFWGSEKGRDKRPTDFGRRTNFDGESEDLLENGTEVQSARGGNTFNPKGWSPTAESSTTATSWSSATDPGHGLCHDGPIPCHLRWHWALSALPRTKAEGTEKRRSPKGPLAKRAPPQGEEDGGWSTSWSDSPSESVQSKVSPAPPALFGSSPVAMFGIFAPPLEHRV